MARGADREKEEVLTEEDFKRIRQHLAQLDANALKEVYERAHQDCRLIYKRFPSPRAMQMLVQVWKQLRKWR
jgi:hypothetical protein